MPEHAEWGVQISNSRPSGLVWSSGFSSFSWHKWFSSRKLRKDCWHRACHSLLVHVPGRTAWHWRVTKSHRNQPKYSHWSGCLCYSLTCFPSRASVFVIVQCCGLADFIPTSVAFYTLSFNLGKQVINEWNKNLHLTLEQLHRFRLELFLWQAEICTFPKFLSNYRNVLNISVTTMQSGHLFRGEGKIRTDTCDTGWVGRVFSSYHWSH